jgi:diguanylate cyclase (GGDEF)-like protein
MHWHFTPFVIPALLAGTIATVLALLAWQRRLAPGAGMFSLMMAGMALWTFGYALELAGSDLDTKHLWLKINFIGVLIVPTAWVIFAFQYTGREKWLRRWNLAGLLIMPLLTLGVIWTNHLHGWFWKDLTLVAGPGYLALLVAYGPAFLVHAIYSYLLNLAGAFLILWTFMGTPRPYLGQKLALIAGILVPMVANFTFLTRTFPLPGLDPTPFAMIITGLVAAWSIFSFRLFDLVPIARSFVVEKMGDGVIVLDAHNRIADLNVAAAAVLKKSTAELVGQAAGAAFAPWADPVWSFQGWAKARNELTIGADEDKRVYELHFSPLHDAMGGVAGRLIVFRDITERKQVEADLKRRAEVINTLLAISETIGSTLDVAQVLDRIVIAAHRLVKTDRVAVFTWDEAASVLLPVIPRPGSKVCLLLPPDLIEPFANLRLHPEQIPIVKAMVDLRLPMTIDNALDSPLIPADLARQFGLRSLLAVPLVLQDRLIGGMGLDRAQGEAFTADEVELITALARQAALAMERARLYHESQQTASELAALYRISAPLLHLGSDLSALAGEIVEAVIQEFTFAYCSILQFDEAAHELKVIAQAGYHLRNTRLPIDGPGLTVAAYCMGKVICVPDVLQDARYVAGAETTRSELVYPLRVGSKIIGVLNLESPEIDAFDAPARRVVAAFAERAALALENSMLFEAAERQASYMSQINEITRIALETTDFKVLLQTLADRLASLLAADTCFITLWDAETRTTIPAAASGELRTVYSRLPPLFQENTLTTSVLDAGRSLVAEDVFNSPYIDPQIAGRFPRRSMLGLPLIADNQRLGAVLLAFNAPHRFTAAEIHRGEQAAAQVALALAKERALDLAQRRAQEAENLRQATSALGSALDLKSVLNSILIHLDQVVPYDSACIFLADGEHLRAVAGKGFPFIDQVVDQTYPSSDALLQATLSMGRPLILDDAQADPRFQKWGETSYVHGWMGVPLIGHGETIGFLTLDSRTIAAFGPEAASLAQAFANQATVAIENARLYEAAKIAAERRAVLYRASQEVVSASLQPEQIYTAIHRAVAQLMPSEAFVIGLVDEARQETEFVYLFDKGGRYPAMRLPVGQGMSGKVIASGKPLYVPDQERQPKANVAHFGDPEHVQSLLTVPLATGGKVFGIISTQSYRPNAYVSEDMALLEMLAAHISVALENTRLFKELQRLAVTDAMTGIYNLRGFFELGRREIDRARRFVHPLAVLFFDIDHFKRVNDLYQDHKIGDQVLRQLAERCRANVRDVDILGRYGGEEFVALLPETDMAEAVLVAERLRRAAEAEPMLTERGPIYVTISLGISGASQNIPDLETLINQADTAMYQAKQTGRNRFVVFTGPAAGPAAPPNPPADGA